MADNIEEMATKLKSLHPVYEKIFNELVDWVNLQPEEQTLAQQLFVETFPSYRDKSFERFKCIWVAHMLNKNMNPNDAFTQTETSEICPEDVYDPRLQRKVKAASVLPYPKRRKLEKFDLSKFIRQRREQNEYFELSMQGRCHVEDWMDDLLTNEEKPLNDQRADLALNRMVQMCAILNGICCYRILELHSEKRIR